MTDPLQPEPILQTRLLDAPWSSAATSRLPGTGPVAPGDWLRVDEAYAGQMGLRDRLIAQAPDAVHALRPQAVRPSKELLAQVLGDLRERPGFTVEASAVRRPDGVRVALDYDAPLLTLGRLVQQDFCILQRDAEEHVLTGAILCFPASWSLAEKFGRPLAAIHAPVTDYDADIARRVQRLFDAVRPEQPLWRVNLLLYADYSLHQPRRETDRRSPPPHPAPFVRSERQCISRLPVSKAIVFAIHTIALRRTDLPSEIEAELIRYRPETA